MTPLRMMEMPSEERPRERLSRLGAASLKNTELIAILLRTGVQGQSALQLAEQILAKYGTLAALSRASMLDLAQIKGIGRTKALQLVAAFALGGRLSTSFADTLEMDTPEKIYQLLGDEMRLLQQESSRVILVNAKLRLLIVQEISRGSLDSVMAHPREVFRPALQHQAYGLILVHNHPTGDPTPSLADHRLTSQLKKAGELLEIRFLDHVILGAPQSHRPTPYYSFKENGYLT